MLKTLFLGAALATTMGYAAQAQSDTAPSGVAPQSQAPAQAAADANTPNTAKPGMVVKDASGATVGTVVQVGQATNGLSAVVVNIDGKPISLAANMLTPAGDGLVSSLSKDEIKAAAAKQGAG
jgi:hypothetical protein